MSETDEMRKYAEAHVRGYIEITIRETPGGGMISKRVYVPVRPLPCVRDERGEIKKQTVKQLFAKVDEELNEVKSAFVIWHTSKISEDQYHRKHFSEEAADTITAITTLCEALGIDADMRDEAQRKVNEKNRERGRL